MCDPLITHGPYLSALEIRLGIIKRYRNVVFTQLYFADYVTQECFFKGAAHRRANYREFACGHCWFNCVCPPKIWCSSVSLSLRNWGDFTFIKFMSGKLCSISLLAQRRHDKSISEIGSFLCLKQWLRHFTYTSCNFYWGEGGEKCKRDLAKVTWPFKFWIPSISLEWLKV